MLALAFIPGLVLLFTVWKLDTIEKESPILLLKLFCAGAAVMLIDILLRTLGLKLLENRVYLFVHRADNVVKKGAEIIGGFVSDTEPVGPMYGKYETKG